MRSAGSPRWCCGKRPASRCWRRAGRACAFPGSTSSPCRRSTRTRRSASSSSGRLRSTRRSLWTTGGRRSSRASAAGWTACPWRSSSPLPAPACSASKSWRAALTNASGSSPAAGVAWSVTTRCAPRSTGRTTSSPRWSGSSSRACRSSPAAAPSRPRSSSSRTRTLPLTRCSTCSPSLVDKSLVVVDRTRSETRYDMLESIRQYAQERLVESGDADRRPGSPRELVRGLRQARPGVGSTRRTSSNGWNASGARSTTCSSRWRGPSRPTKPSWRSGSARRSHGRPPNARSSAPHTSPSRRWA